MNREIQKNRNLDIQITENNLEVIYTTQDEFDVNILLKNWSKAITVPYRVANYLNKKYIFIINNKEIDNSQFLNKVLE